jgi:hypothetical protein
VPVLEDEPLGDEVLDDELPDVESVELDPDDVPEPPGVVVDDGGVDGVDGVVDGVVAVGGDADGVRSPGRSPTRSVRDSLQAVSSPALRARAQKPVSNLFIWKPPPCGVARTLPKGATGMPPRRLDTVRHNHYQCG